jgi:N-acetylneuraminate synthase
LTWKRPAHGISPKDINEVIGMKAIRLIEEDEIINWDMLSAK